MNHMRKLATKEDIQASVEPLFTPDEVAQRQTEYPILPPGVFAKKERKLWARPVTFQVRDNQYQIQFNTCTNPFCPNFGLQQERFTDLKGKPSRYKIVSTKNDSLIDCTVYGCSPFQPSLGNKSTLLSNWAIAEEITRLEAINSVVPDVFVIDYHKEECPNYSHTPKTHPKSFTKQGLSKVGAQVYKCKTCAKKTSEQPKQNRAFSYGQQKNDVLLSLFEDLINRTPVNGTIRKNGIGASTYYHKLEWLYRKCLEFLERHETQVLENKEFDSLYLNTDAFMYNLNYKRLKSNGMRGNREENKLPTTYMYATTDVQSGYVFRTDFAYDYNVKLDEIEQDTMTYHCDHTLYYIRKNERLRHEYAPQPPIKMDTQTQEEYELERFSFDDKKNYVDGLHVKPTYTCMAHMWLLKKSLKAKKYYFINDQDMTIQTSIFRIFAEELKTKQSHVIGCQVDKSLTRNDAFAVAMKQRREFEKWAQDWGYDHLNTNQRICAHLEEQLAYHDFYEEKVIDGVFYPYKGENPIQFPYPAIDEGFRYLTCMTDVREMELEELAKVMSHANMRSIDDFFQKIHRSISVLERPLTTSRGDGKSYIYANFNPKYAHYAVTILRVYYNFCLTNKKFNDKKTPAQRLGITDKVFTIKDIVYFK